VRVSESFLKDRVVLHCGDCRDVLVSLEENSIDSCVTDPPYHLTSQVATVRSAFPGRYAGTAGGAKAGFMGKQWDGGDIAFRPELWAQVYRVLKPGAHLLAFGGTRTYHRMACAIEDAGFEIRDCVQWLYGSGFPKSHDVSKGIDRAAGAAREVVGEYVMPADSTAPGRRPSQGLGYGSDLEASVGRPITAPTTPAARQWEGWGTALKPACELIVLARKPLSEGTVAANVLKWGTGAINVDGCRIQTSEVISGRVRTAADGWGMQPDVNDYQQNANGRWPANVIHNGSEEVVGAFPEAGGGFGVRGESPNWGPASNGGGTMEVVGYGDSGSAARFFYAARPDEPSADRRYTDQGATNFSALPGARRSAVPANRLFYTAKADSDDRLGSKHPTVKPLDLMQYLVRLITPPKGTCLDPFAGTGTTGEAAFREGMSAVLIEREAEYQDDIRRRMKLVMSGPDERARESIKQRMNGKPRDDGPLFEFYNADRDFSESINECYRDIRERVANGGPGWGGWPE
jgi:DNA modification methylase